MKIHRIETMILKAPTGSAAFYSSQARFPERTSTLVKITTDDGTTGWGEGGQYGPGEPVASAITDILGPRLIGEAADAPVRIWERNYAFLVKRAMDQMRMERMKRAFFSGNPDVYEY